jgi:hypothetical protein
MTMVEEFGVSTPTSRPRPAIHKRKRHLKTGVGHFAFSVGKRTVLDDASKDLGLRSKHQ